MDGRDRVIKHLEMIQGIVNRLGHDSFLLKGWSMTILVAALIFISKTQLENKCFIPIFLIPVLGFWTLDGYFLWQERLFREIYNDVRTWKETDFSMNVVKHMGKPNRGWPSAVFSRTLIIFYGIEILFIISAFVSLKASQ